MSFSAEIGDLTPAQLLTGLQAMLATYDEPDGEEAAEDTAHLAAAVYVLGKAVTFLMDKELARDTTPRS